MKRGFAIAVTGLLFVVTLCFHETAPVVAQGRSLSSGPIVLRRCRVQLKDRVTLAGERVGILEFVGPEEGDLVQAGEQVVRLKDDVAKAALNRTEKESENDVEIRYAIKASEVAIAELERSLEANAKQPGTIPKIELERLRLAAERSRLQIEQAQHRYIVAKLTADESRAALETFRVDAPFDGIVTRVFKAKGEAVRQGDPILELVNTEVVRVEGYVSVKDMFIVRPNSLVRVQLDIPDAELPVEREIFEGRIAFVDVSANPVTGQVRIWAEVPNRGNILRAGLTATMVIDPTRTVPDKTAAKSREVN